MVDDSVPAEDLRADTPYTVVARRYRPRTFAELIGQDHIAQALGKAVSTGRVGHAYLFTGARGVGKTSTARIFAKVLNLPEGTAQELVDEISQAIDAGEDIDVIEIDGASNRGIEEIRQLRANVNVRPSRSPNKIYIIDEVHMLTNQAFNALLKTLEEPPPHVKFIFCTTDPDKIPITVLSRCQRFDFAPVGLEDIKGRLAEICTGEGFEADEEALALLARRAAGSMRDSQSLLEQVMSFSSDRITVEQVHALLGTADESRLQALAEAMIAQDSLQALQLVDASIRAGSDAGQLAEQLLNYLRDLMAVSIGGDAEILKLANPSGFENLKELADKWGTQTMLSAIQVLDESLVRMRTSVSSTTLLEVALVQICQLEHLANIPELLNRLANRPPSAEKKKAEAKLAPPARTKEVPATNQARSTPAAQPSAAESKTRPQQPQPEAPASNDKPKVELSSDSQARQEEITKPASSADAAQVGSGPEAPEPDSTDSEPSPQVQATPPAPGNSASTPAEPALGSNDAMSSWQQALRGIDGMLADFASLAKSVEPLASDRWRIVFPQGATQPKEYCELAERKQVLQATLAKHLGRDIQLQFQVVPGEAPKPVAAVPQATLRVQKMRQLSEDPYVKTLCDILDGEIVRVDSPRVPKPQSAPKANGSANGKVNGTSGKNGQGSTTS